MAMQSVGFQQEHGGFRRRCLDRLGDQIPQFLGARRVPAGTIGPCFSLSWAEIVTVGMGCLRTEKAVAYGG